jgi:hypothetical protein
MSGILILESWFWNLDSDKLIYIIATIPPKNNGGQALGGGS